MTKELWEMTKEELAEQYRLYACKVCRCLFCECPDDDESGDESDDESLRKGLDS
jgi:hypothetical protein